MIPIEAFMALTAFACLCTAFGYVLRGIVDEARRGRSEGKNDPYKDDGWEDDIS